MGLVGTIPCDLYGTARSLLRMQVVRNVRRSQSHGQHGVGAEVVLVLAVVRVAEECVGVCDAREDALESLASCARASGLQFGSAAAVARATICVWASAVRARFSLGAMLFRKCLGFS